jgi:hypothetical protein
VNEKSAHAAFAHYRIAGKTFKDSRHLAMEASVADHVWSLEEIVGLLP